MEDRYAFASETHIVLWIKEKDFFFERVYRKKDGELQIPERKFSAKNIDSKIKLVESKGYICVHKPTEGFVRLVDNIGDSIGSFFKQLRF